MSFTCLATVESVAPLAGGFLRCTVQADELRDRRIGVADAVKLFVPAPGQDFAFPPVGDDGLPYWPDGAPRATARCYTVRALDPRTGRLTVDLAWRDDGPSWPERLRPGLVVGVGGTMFGYRAAPGTTRHVLVGDRTALPAAAVVVASLPADATIEAVLETPDVDERALLPEHPGLSVRLLVGPASAGTGSALAAAAREVAVDGAHHWVAAEAGVVSEVRASWVDRPGSVQAVVHWERDRTWDQRDDGRLVAYRRAVADGRDLTDPQVQDEIELSVRS